MTKKTGKACIWDIIRKKWLILTPEEYVRQHFVHYLIHTLSYPASYISIERGFEVNRLQSRSDIVVYNHLKLPHIIIECKAPLVRITQTTLEQASKYNLKLRAEYLCVTNGLEHACYQINFETPGFKKLSELPKFIFKS